MKNLRRLFVPLSFFVCAAASAGDISVSVPQTQLTLERSKAQPPSNEYFIEAQVSSWRPDNFTATSQLNNTSSFTAKTPSMSLAIGESLYQNAYIRLAGKLGAGFTQLQRSGVMGFDATRMTMSENLNMLQASAGLEVAGAQEWVNTLRPMAAVSLVPTWSQAASSEFSDGINQWDWLAKVSTGLEFNIRPVARWMGLQETAFEIGIENTQSLTASSLSGTGVWAGTRIGWQ